MSEFLSKISEELCLQIRITYETTRDSCCLVYIPSSIDLLLDWRNNHNLKLIVSHFSHHIQISCLYLYRKIKLNIKQWLLTIPQTTYPTSLKNSISCVMESSRSWVQALVESNHKLLQMCIGICCLAVKHTALRSKRKD